MNNHRIIPIFFVGPSEDFRRNIERSEIELNGGTGRGSQAHPVGFTGVVPADHPVDFRESSAMTAIPMTPDIDETFLLDFRPNDVERAFSAFMEKVQEGRSA